MSPIPVDWWDRTRAENITITITITIPKRLTKSTKHCDASACAGFADYSELVETPDTQLGCAAIPNDVLVRAYDASASQGVF